MKILICVDHEIVRVGIKHILQQLSGVTCIEEARDGNEVLAILENSNFDIVLLNVSLPGISGLEVLKLIKAKWKSINVLMLSMHSQEQRVIRALKLGAAGYLTKDTVSEELLVAVKKIAESGKYISQSLVEQLALYVDNESNVAKHDALSKREYETMIKLANGKSLLEIGDELSISIKTVSTYRTRIMRKMDLRQNTELTKYCLSNELI